MTISILLADDHVLVRDGLRMLLEAQPDLRVVASVADGQQAVDEALRVRPDVAVLDVSMPVMGGIEAARCLQAQCPAVRVVMLSMHDHPEHVHRALEAGALGYLLKDSAGSEIAVAVRAVHAGRRYLDERLGDFAAFGPRDPGRGPVESLSAREREVLHLIVEGCSNADAARQLNLSVKTVETYRSRLMQKLGLRNVAELVKFAISQGLARAE